MAGETSWYFDAFEERQPPPPSAVVVWRETLWQLLATIALGVGLWYLQWRWFQSLNMDALWFAIPLALAETLSYIGLVLMFFNLWQVSDTPPKPVPGSIGDCEGTADPRPLRIDLFITTYSEDPELVRLGLMAAKRVTYSEPAEIKVHCLDDGRRPAMQKVAEECGVNYIARSTNEGYKAGNLRNALELTDGDFVVICDADTRLFPEFLERTMGYFRDSHVAWVQTPQWFFDLPDGEPLEVSWGRRLGGFGRALARGLQKIAGPIRTGSDPFDNNPQFFFDVIQRRRNGANASFCCGASSIHRREAIWQSALRAYATAIDRKVDNFVDEVTDPESREALDEALRHQFALDENVTPYKFHVSEDIYTSIALHGDPDRPWRSVYHPEVLSKMLSPQDMAAWAVQRYKYAAGTLDIAVHDSPLYKHKLTISQRLMYLATIWSYLSCLWTWMFLVSPAVYLFTGIPPITAFSLEFFKHFLPFVISTELALLIGSWGVPNSKGRAIYMGFFPYGLKALWTVLRGKPVRFPVTPKERQSGIYLRLVRWQVAVMIAVVLSIIWASYQLLFAGTRSDEAGYTVNVLWGLYTLILMASYVRAAVWRPASESKAGA